MWQTLQPIIDSLFVGPIWPASVMILIVFGYLLVSLVTTLDLDSPDVDLNADGWQSLGGTTLRWLHLDTIPLVLWAGLFATANWLIAYILWNAFDSLHYAPTLVTSALLATRNAVMAGVITKVVTAPLVPYLAKSYGYDDQSLIGNTAVVSSGEATPRFGQAKFDTGGAPLLLNIRTDGPHLTKGTVVRILSYEPSKRTYIVTPQSVSDSTVAYNESQT